MSTGVRRCSLGAVLLALLCACSSAPSDGVQSDAGAKRRNEQAQDRPDGGQVGEAHVDRDAGRADAARSMAGASAGGASGDAVSAGRGLKGEGGVSGAAMQPVAGTPAGVCDPASCPTAGPADACCLDGHCSSDYGMGCGVPPPADMSMACVRDRCIGTSAGPVCCASENTCGVSSGGMCVTHAPASGQGCAALTPEEIAQKCDPLPADCMYRETESCLTPLELTGLLKECSAAYDACPSATDVLPIGSGSPCEYVLSGPRAVSGRCCYITRERFCPK